MLRMTTYYARNGKIRTATTPAERVALEWKGYHEIDNPADSPVTAQLGDPETEAALDQAALERLDTDYNGNAAEPEPEVVPEPRPTRKARS